MIILKILIFIVCFILLICFIRVRFINPRKIRSLFNDNISIGIVGERRSGKDTLMSWLSSYDKEHNSNIALQKNTNVVSFKQIMIQGINRKTLVNGYHLNIDRKPYSFLDNNTYISDTGLYFPNYDDEALKKEYPYFSSQLAIWGHLFEGTIHFNTQRYSKIWLQIREHINHVVECRGTTWLLGYVILRVRFYENVKDYEDGKTPLNIPLLKKNNPNIVVEKSNRGEIKDILLLLKRKRINHDTHIFRTIVFKEEKGD